MMPLKVSCYAFNGVVSDGYLPLDPILAALWMREHHPEQFWGDSVRAKDNLIEADLPLQRLGSEHNWYYASSFCQAGWIGSETRHWHKRHTAQEQTRYIGQGRINVAQGQTKAYRMPLFVLHPGGRLTWYLVGDRAWLEARLPLITAIGHKRAQGNGIVIDWRVEPVDQDASVILDHRLMRSLPLSDVPPETIDLRVARYGLRPPYWHRANQEWVALPLLKGISYDPD